MNPVSYDQQILEETPAKVIPFLRALATNTEIRAAMYGCGYTEQEQSHAWKLLLSATGYAPAGLASFDDEKARAAIAELDAWDESGFRRVHAALGRLHPDQDAFVFAGLDPVKGPGAVASVATLLDRLDALESSADRTATREADRAAIATLAARGIDTTLRARLREVVKVAQTAKQPVAAEVVPAAADRQNALRELRAWHKDWSETAHAVIRRRDQLILMGLAKRYSRQEGADDGEIAASVTDGANAAASAASSD